MNMDDPAVLRAVLDHASTAFAIVEGEEHLCTWANAAFRGCGIKPGVALTQAFPAVDRALLEEAGGTRQPQKRRSGAWDLEATPLCGAERRVCG